MRPVIVVPTLPKIASRKLSCSCVINWLPSTKLNRYLRASLRIVSKLSVAKFWNSSTYNVKSLRSSSGIFARAIAAAWNFITKIIPRSFEFKSPIFPFDKFASKILRLFIISAKLNPLFFCPIIFRIASLEINGPNFDTTQLITSPASLDRCDAGNSFVQKSSTCWSVTYFSLLFINASSISNFGISINVPPPGSLISSNAQFRNICSRRGPTIPVCPGSYSPYSIPIASCTKKSFWSGWSNSNIFNPIGLSMSLGLK